MCVFFGTWAATNMNISRNFRNSRLHDRPWPGKILCQTNFPRHLSRTKMLGKCVSTNWRTDIAYDFQDPELWIKTHFCHPKFLLAFSGFDAPEATTVLFKAGGKPSTWLPPGGLVQRFEKNISIKTRTRLIPNTREKRKQQQQQNTKLTERGH